MKKCDTALLLLAALAVMLLGGCSSSSTDLPLILQNQAPLSAANLNLIFVVSPDSAYHPAGDIQSDTANLTSQGLNRSLLMGSFLPQQVLGSRNVTGIYALQPMSHMQKGFPDMAALVNVQQFAMLNQITLLGEGKDQPPFTTGNSYPLNTSYMPGAIPDNVITPSTFCPDCQGLAFLDGGGYNAALATTIINSKIPGFHLFSAPWETIRTLVTTISTAKGYNLALSTEYTPNQVYAISITPSGRASLITYESRLNPPVTYPEIPGLATLLGSVTCPNSTTTTPQGFSITVTKDTPDAVIPLDVNRNETLYMIRHAEAHPTSSWEEGNYVAAGQWRALALPMALRGIISPDVVYSIDPAQLVSPPSSTTNWSYVRPSLTVAPYVIANNLPFYLVANFELFPVTSSVIMTSDFFFKDSRFFGKTILLAWEHDHIPLVVKALLNSYFPHGGGPNPPLPSTWPSSDYDTIWTVSIDAKGNLTVNNTLCEGIDSALLPTTAPRF